MRTEALPLTPQLKQLLQDHFVLLKSQNPKKGLDTLQLNLSGYSDVMYLIADIVKVSILALEGDTNYVRIPEPVTNISGVLSIILDLIPYEEADLLDNLRASVFKSPETALTIDDEIDIENYFITPPSNLTSGNN